MRNFPQDNNANSLNVDSRFLEDINVKHIYKKTNKPVQIQFEYAYLYEWHITNWIYNLIKHNNVYAVYIKMRYSEDKFCMVDDKCGFYYKNSNDLIDVFSDMRQRIGHCINDIYQLAEEDIVYIQTTFRWKDKLLADFGYNKDNVKHFKVEDVADNNKLMNRPFSINPDSLAIPLPINIDMGFITNIDVNIYGNLLNFLYKIKEKSSYLRIGRRNHISSFDSGYYFYLLSIENKKCILAVKINKHYIDKIKFTLTGNVFNRVVYNFEGDMLKRVTGNKIIFIKDDKIIKVEESIQLLPLHIAKSTPDRVEDNYFGVIETELYTCNDNVKKVYAIGFKSILDNTPIMYYMDPHKVNGDAAIILEFIDEILRSKYSKIT